MGKAKQALVKDFLLGYFKDETNMVEAVKQLRQAGFEIHDVYTPYAVHSLDEAMGLKRSRLAIVTFFASLSGLILSLFFQFWTNVSDWNVNVGGKPDNSTLAFIPVSFEITILFGALVTVAAFFIRSRLFPGKKSGSAVCTAEITNDQFLIALHRANAGFDLQKAKSIIQTSGAQRVLETSTVEETV